jgi:hypothetical protein
MTKDERLNLWDELLRDGRNEAAAGLLCDEFRNLHYAVFRWRPLASPERRDEDQAFRQQQMADHRTVIREMLDDIGGDEFDEWWQLYCAGRDAVRQRAREYIRQMDDAHESGLWRDEEPEPAQP